MDFREQVRTDRRGAADELKKLFGGSWVTFSEESSGVPGASLAAQFAQDSTGRSVLVGVILLGDAITADALRRVPVTALENSVNLSRKGADRELRAELRKLGPLRRDASMTPEAFSARVAEHYRVWARYTPHPAAAIAAEWNVKAPTVAGWIREARLRGLLPAGPRGKSKAARS